MRQISQSQTMRCDLDPESRVAKLLLQAPARSVIDEAFASDLTECLTLLAAQREVRGIVVESAHDDFCMGADLDAIAEARLEARALYEQTMKLHAAMRRLEQAGVPVVALLAGSATGRGLELALACHRRVALDLPSMRLGLPELSFGLIPGAGGTQRLARLLGFRRAIELVLQGTLLDAREALAAGIVDEVCEGEDACRRAAERWIAEHPRASQPWDRAGFVFPSPAPDTRAASELFLGAAAALVQKTAGAPLAPRLALSALHEGGLLRFPRALELEARYFVQSACSAQAEDLSRTLWQRRRAAERLEDLPRGVAEPVRKVAIVGAGMMGADLACLAAESGCEVVLVDRQADALERARDRWARVARSSGMAERAPERIHSTLVLADVGGADLLIEAVYEQLELKQHILSETEPLLAPGGLWATNTSALPIGRVCARAARPEQTLGLHFFSPARRMALVELVKGARTSEATVGRALAFCRRLGKVPIVVNDGYGFYTTRVFLSYVMEGVTLVAEGYAPALVEWAARAAGMVVGPLQVADEVSLELACHIADERRQFGGGAGDLYARAETFLRHLVQDHGRRGRAAGAGFYDYKDGQRQALWRGLEALAQGPRAELDAAAPQVIGRRLLLAQAVQAVQALEEGVLERRRDAELGAVLGVGFAPVTGGPLSYLDRFGLPQALAELERLEAAAGARFAPPRLLRELAQRGARFFAE